MKNNRINFSLSRVFLVQSLNNHQRIVEDFLQFFAILATLQRIQDVPTLCYYNFGLTGKKPALMIFTSFLETRVHPILVFLYKDP
ncbi:hypothetical protein Scep_024109 [Stephania cephalantha]|uniref:Uncharacterized protein n=1 Tax=Stephania cephalantha TaxID=152367 RepID=A0AAP0HY33_9MAGN